MGDIAPEGAYSFMLWTSGQILGQVREEGGAYKKVIAAAGSICAFDLTSPPRVTVETPFTGTRAHVPLAAIQRFSEEGGGRRRIYLTPPPSGTVDSIIQHLLVSLGHAFQHPEEENALFVDHIGSALQAHLLRAYGTSIFEASRVRRGLAPWQERRAKELIDDSLGKDISIAILAAECGLSSSHFARAFKQTTGRPPHRWLLERRVEIVQDLLLNSDLSLREIATACRFADQNHLTRAFSRIVGASPGSWRRAKRG